MHEYTNLNVTQIMQAVTISILGAFSFVIQKQFGTILREFHIKGLTNQQIGEQEDLYTGFMCSDSDCFLVYNYTQRQICGHIDPYTQVSHEVTPRKNLKADSPDLRKEDKVDLRSRMPGVAYYLKGNTC